PGHCANVIDRDLVRYDPVATVNAAGATAINGSSPLKLDHIIICGANCTSAGVLEGADPGAARRFPISSANATSKAPSAQTQKAFSRLVNSLAGPSNLLRPSSRT